MFPAVFNLADLNGKNGFVINGIGLGMENAISVSGAGDVNGDGLSDIIIGSSYANNGAGQSAVVLGNSSGFNATFNLAALNGANGFVINGPSNSYSGSSVSGAGNISGYGIDGMIIGSITGYSCAIFSSSGFNATFNLADLDGTNGFIINEANPGDESGWSVAKVGDLDNNGTDDIIVCAPSANNSAGQCAVIFGGQKFNKIFDLANLNGKNGFFINGIINSYAEIGISVSGASDVNNDKIDDLVVCGPNTNYKGQCAVIFGGQKFNTTFDLANINGENGFFINGMFYDIATDDGKHHSDVAVSMVGDLNGNGINDIAICFACANPYGLYEAGQCVVVFGSDKFNKTLDVAYLDGTNGFVINGIHYSDKTGKSVSGVGDVNGDGLSDMLIGAPGAGQAGKSYMVFGNSSGFNATFNLAALNGANGFVMNGINFDEQSGTSVSGVGDITGDGLPDVLIGSFFGNAYMVYGDNNTIPIPIPIPILTPTPTLLPTPTITLTSTKTPEPGVTASSTPTPSTSFGASHTSTPTPSTSFNPHHENPNSDDHGLSAGAIAGIAVGGVVALGAVIGTVWWHCHKHASVVGEATQYAELETGS